MNRKQITANCNPEGVECTNSVKTVTRNFSCGGLMIGPLQGPRVKLNFQLFTFIRPAPDNPPGGYSKHPQLFFNP